MWKFARIILFLMHLQALEVGSRVYVDEMFAVILVFLVHPSFVGRFEGAF